jgi:hypothetical protein
VWGLNSKKVGWVGECVSILMMHAHKSVTGSREVKEQ